jgi:hypothetical protein
MSQTIKIAGGLVLGLLAAACDRPTAPQVRDAVEKAQTELMTGVFQQRSVQQYQQIQYALERTNWYPKGLVEVERGGRPERYVATVMERVYLPPAASGAAPYVRRMLIAWDAEAHRGIVLASDDSDATITFPSPALNYPTNPSRLWQRIAFATQIESGSGDAWYASEGALTFRLGPVSGPCTRLKYGGDFGFPFTERETKKADICQEVSYRVSAAAVLEHRSPDKGPGVLDRWTTSKVNVRLPEATVPGIRIITQCPEWDGKSIEMVGGCMNVFDFWRDQSQFAPELGVDLSRMTEVGTNNGLFMQHWIVGTGPEFQCCERMVNVPVRYTISLPNGTVLRKVETNDPGKDTILTRVRFLRLGAAVREGSRTLVFGQGLGMIHNQYTPLLLDLSILPCPQGTRRDTTLLPGSAYASGVCYPVTSAPLRE